MTVKEIRAAIQAKTGSMTFAQVTNAGVAVGVPSCEPYITNWSLVPIDDESRPRFVDYMVSLSGALPVGPWDDVGDRGDSLS